MSQRKSGYALRENSHYPTPTWVTKALLPHLPKGLVSVWECAAGTGIMADVFRDAGFRVSATDITTGHDFLKETSTPFEVDLICTNPPFSIATEFIEHALKLMEPSAGAVAMLLRCDFDHAKSRTHLFRDNPSFYKKVVLNRRITWFDPGPGNRAGKSPSFNHAWALWSHRHEGPPTLGYGP